MQNLNPNQIINLDNSDNVQIKGKEREEDETKEKD